MPTSDQIAAALGGYPHDSEGNVQTPSGTQKAMGSGGGGGSSKSKPKPKPQSQFTPEQLKAASDAGLNEQDLVNRQNEGIKAAKKGIYYQDEPSQVRTFSAFARQNQGIKDAEAGIFYQQQPNLYSSPEARQFKAIKDAERGIYYQQVPNLYTEADQRNYQNRVKESEAAQNALKPYTSGDGSNRHPYSYDIVNYLRDNPNKEAVENLRKAGFQKDDIDKAQIESLKPESLESYTDRYLKKNHPNKGYTESNIKSRKKLDGESYESFNKRMASNDDILREATDAYVKKYGKGALIGTGAARVGEFVFAPARALRPEVTIKDITKEEWIIGGAQVCLIGCITFSG
jgi:hypothetical protein